MLFIIDNGVHEGLTHRDVRMVGAPPEASMAVYRAIEFLNARGFPRPQRLIVTACGETTSERGMIHRLRGYLNLFSILPCRMESRHAYIEAARALIEAWDVRYLGSIPDAILALTKEAS